MFEYRIRRDKFSKDGDAVIGKITIIGHDTVTMEPLKYGKNIKDFMVSELSNKSFKCLAQVTKVGRVEVYQLQKVDED